MNKTVRQGDQGADVRRMQAALSAAGFYSANIDGIFGNYTKTTLGRFQKAQGWTPDYICGAKTWKALEPFLNQFVGALTFRVLEQVDGLDDFKTLSGLLED